jgi:hypothetical protein
VAGNRNVPFAWPAKKTPSKSSVWKWRGPPVKDPAAAGTKALKAQQHPLAAARGNLGGAEASIPESIDGTKAQLREQPFSAPQGAAESPDLEGYERLPRATGWEKCALTTREK